PKAAWVLLASAIVRLPKVARPRMRASLPLLLLDDPHRDRLRRRALRTTECQDNHSVGVRYASSPHFHSPIWKFARSGTLSVNTHARDLLYFHHGLLGATPRCAAVRRLRTNPARACCCSTSADRRRSPTCVPSSTTSSPIPTSSGSAAGSCATRWRG